MDFKRIIVIAIPVVCLLIFFEIFPIVLWVKCLICAACIALTFLLTRPFFNHQIKDTLPSALPAEFLKSFLDINESGHDVVAKVLSVSETGKYIDQHPFISIYLEVHEEDKMPFNIHSRTLVNKRLVPRVGDYCRLRYNEAYPEEVLITALL